MNDADRGLDGSALDAAVQAVAEWLAPDKKHSIAVNDAYRPVARDAVVEYLEALGGRLPDPAKNTVGASRRSDPSTSKKAARDNLPRSGTQRGRCLDAVHKAGERGLTASEIEQKLKLPTSSASKRMGELEGERWIEPNGQRRKTLRGGQGQVYVLTRKALKEYKKTQRLV